MAALFKNFPETLTKTFLWTVMCLFLLFPGHHSVHAQEGLVPDNEVLCSVENPEGTALTPKPVQQIAEAFLVMISDIMEAIQAFISAIAQ